MSSRKGDTKKKGQKHKNLSGYKNNKYGSTKTTEILNNMTVSNVCQRCKDKIEWRIKFNKYTPLSAPKKCVKCSEKTVKYAYHTACTKCSVEQRICAKCLQIKEVVEPPTVDPSQRQRDMAAVNEGLKYASLRERRTFMRQLEQGNVTEASLLSTRRKNDSEIDDEDITDEDDEDDEDIEDIEDEDYKALGNNGIDDYIGEGIREEISNNDIDKMNSKSNKINDGEAKDVLKLLDEHRECITSNK